MIYTREMYLSDMRRRDAFLMNGLWHMPDGTKEENREYTLPFRY